MCCRRCSRALRSRSLTAAAALRLSAVDAAVRKLDLPSVLYPIRDGGSNIPSLMRIRINRRNAVSIALLFVKPWATASCRCEMACVPPPSWSSPALIPTAAASSIVFV